MAIRVLLLKTSSLGDVIHTLPALTDAKNSISGIQFDWVVEEAFAEIPGWHPAVNAVIPVAIRRWRKKLVQTWRSGEWRRFRQTVGSRQYDLIIDAQGLLKSALLTRLNPAESAGFDRESVREPAASRFYQRRFQVARDQHAVERTRDLFAQALGYAKPVSAPDYGLNLHALPQPSSDLIQSPAILFLHGTTWDTKLWPQHYWASLLKMVNAQGYTALLPWGNDAEKRRAEAIAQAGKATVLPRLGLAELASLMRQMAGIVAVDTGLGHLAAALGRPCVALYGPTNPVLTGNYGPNQQVLSSQFQCAPCMKKTCALAKGVSERYPVFPPCFEELNPDRVWFDLEQLIQRSPSQIPGGAL